jgi:hypothetical protein
MTGRARDKDFVLGPFMGGATFYPYQAALGVSLRYWPCLFAPSIRIHLGPFKVWFALRLKGVR